MELFITFLAGISVLLGALFVKLTSNKEQIEHVSMAMALAALLALLIFDLFPEVMESAEKEGWLFCLIMLAIGFVGLVVLDHFVPEHEDNESNHDTGNAVHIGLISAMALIVHNIVEGMSVYSMMYSDFNYGVIFAVGIALHNIPMGMMIYSTMLMQSKREKMIVFGAVTISTFIGGVLMQILSGHFSETVSMGLVAVASGMILYIVFMELFPHVLRTKGWKLNLLGAAMGFALVFAASCIGG